jgi:hypothetical protein
MVRAAVATAPCRLSSRHAQLQLRALHMPMFSRIPSGRVRSRCVRRGRAAGLLVDASMTRMSIRRALFGVAAAAGGDDRVGARSALLPHAQPDAVRHMPAGAPQHANVYPRRRRSSLGLVECPRTDGRDGPHAVMHPPGQHPVYWSTYLPTYLPTYRPTYPRSSFPPGRWPVLSRSAALTGSHGSYYHLPYWLALPRRPQARRDSHGAIIAVRCGGCGQGGTNPAGAGRVASLARLRCWAS